MVVVLHLPTGVKSLFQYSLCRVVLMVRKCRIGGALSKPVSVLALSSRFDGRKWEGVELSRNNVSVLALSSRFDGLGILAEVLRLIGFQYSLCRVVLMVSLTA